METKSQLQEVRAKLAQLDPNNRDHLAEIQFLKTQEADLLKQEQTVAELQAQREERVKESVEQITNTMDLVEIHGLPLRALFKDEDCYQLVSIWFKQQIADQADELAKQIQAEQLENKQLREEMKEQEVVVNALRDELHQAKLERDQAIQYRDNAHEQLEEARAEVERLNDHVDTLRNEIAVGARNAFKVTNIDGTKELAEKIKASLVPVLGIEQVNGTTIRVTHPDGTTADDNWFSKGKYRIVGGEEAERFRNEAAQKDISEETVSVDPVIEPPTFQIPQNEPVGVPSVQQEADGTANEGSRKDVDQAGTQSIEERIKALEQWKKHVDEVIGVA